MLSVAKWQLANPKHKLRDWTNGSFYAGVFAAYETGWTQPIGSDPRRNFDADSWEVYGAGAFLLAGSEVTKL